MPDNSSQTSKRKKEHIELCLTDDVSFKKNNGFDNYEFLHYAVTEVDLKKINFEVKFLKKKIDFPFLISCMTGGTTEAENINAQLALAANELNIPLGVGSQRQAWEDSNQTNSYKTIRKNAPKIPILGNIGASQVVLIKEVEKYQYLVDMVEADALVVHLNASQELFQKNGEPNFKGLLKNLGKIVKKISVPVIVKEVGAGISKQAAEKLLNEGVKGIDVAGAGGTSWSAVEILRNKESSHNYFSEWGLPTSYCIKNVNALHKKYRFTLIASGGIYSGIDAAKAFALGADLTASARIILQQLDKSGVEGVILLIQKWFDDIKKIMFLTGSQKLSDLKKNKLIDKKDIY